MKSALEVLTLFPDAVEAVLQSSILRRAQAAGLVELGVSNLREFAPGAYKAVDDTPYGGKQGMLFRPDVLETALQHQLGKVEQKRERLKVIYTSPRGAVFDHNIAQALAQWLVKNPGSRIALLCGRYEGVDERAVNGWVDLELSLGDFVLSGGEIAALAVVDAVVRLLPGVLGNESSSREDSFSNGLLEYPQYTKPREFKGQTVPEELLSGHHANIERWNLRQALLLTAAFRPDLIEAHKGEGLAPWAQDLLAMLKKRVESR